MYISNTINISTSICIDMSRRYLCLGTCLGLFVVVECAQAELAADML